MKKLLSHLSIYLTIFVLAVCPIILIGQTALYPHEILSGECGQPGTPQYCKYTINAGLSFVPIINSIECGEWNFSSSFQVTQGGQCVQGISSVEWEYVYTKEYKVDQSTTFYLKKFYNQPIIIKVTITVNTKCDNHLYTFYYTLDQPVCPDGCSSSFCYEDLGPAPANPPSTDYTMELTQVKFHYNDFNGTGYVYLNASNNYGIFNFPYYFYSDDCHLVPNMYDFVDDMNEFLNLAKNNPQNNAYSRFYGHAFLVNSYNPPEDLCKIRVKVSDAGMLMTHFGRQNRYLNDNCGLSYIFSSNPNKPVTHIYNDDCLRLELPPSELGLRDENEFEFEKSENQDQHLIFVYPTIVSENLIIERHNIENTILLKAYSSGGQLINTFKLEKQEYSKTLDLSTFNNGVYFLKVSDINGKCQQIERIAVIK